MATTTGRGSNVKRQDQAAGDEAGPVVRDQVEELARAGARQMLLAALEDEVDSHLQRDRHQRQAEFRAPAALPQAGARQLRTWSRAAGDVEHCVLLSTVAMLLSCRRPALVAWGNRRTVRSVAATRQRQRVR